MVMDQDTTRVPTVERISTTGNDPANIARGRGELTFHQRLTEVRIPGGPGHDHHEDLLVGEIERHGQL